MYVYNSYGNLTCQAVIANYYQTERLIWISLFVLFTSYASDLNKHAISFKKYSHIKFDNPILNAR
jgi:hypothetical protein